MIEEAASDMSDKFEFAGPEWVDVVRECIEALSCGHDLAGMNVSFCEEFTDPPAHLSPTGAPIPFEFESFGVSFTFRT